MRVTLRLAVAALLSIAAFGRGEGTAPSETEPAGPKRNSFAFSESLLIPLRIHLLSATNAPPVHTTLEDRDIVRILGKVNQVWSQAGIHFFLERLIREEAERCDNYQTNWRTGLPTQALLELRPEGTRGSNMLHVYYIKNMSVNGVHMGPANFVRDTASLRRVTGGIDEPLPRVTSHELGHALSLPHRQHQTNLMASGTTGTWLNDSEIEQARAAARKWSWVETAPAALGRAKTLTASRQYDEAALLYQRLLALPIDSVPTAPTSGAEPAPPPAASPGSLPPAGGTGP